MTGRGQPLRKPRSNGSVTSPNSARERASPVSLTTGYGVLTDTRLEDDGDGDGKHVGHCPYYAAGVPLASALTHGWYHLAWHDWVGLAIAMVGMPLTLLGLWLTWKQARDAKDAAQAAQLAVKRTQSQLRANQLMVVVPQLRWIALELDAAIETGNIALTRRFLGNWRSQAGQVKGILSKAANTDPQLLTNIGQSISLAASADGSLFAKPGSPIDVVKTCQKARSSVLGICDQLHEWVGENSTEVTNEEGLL